MGSARSLIIKTIARLNFDYIWQTTFFTCTKELSTKI